jgi:hypothetical protein
VPNPTVTAKNGERVYNDNGRFYTSVTTFIGSHRNPEIEMLRDLLGEETVERYRDKGAIIGTVLHEIFECILLGQDIGEVVLADELMNRVQALKDWKEMVVERVVGTEVEGVDERYGYGYKADAVLRIKGDKVDTLGDLKTGLLTLESRLQTAAYAKALGLKKRGIIHLPKVGPVKFIPYDNLDADFQCFLCYVHIHNWRLRYGK